MAIDKGENAGKSMVYTQVVTARQATPPTSASRWSSAFPRARPLTSLAAGPIRDRIARSPVVSSGDEFVLSMPERYRPLVAGR